VPAARPYINIIKSVILPVKNIPLPVNVILLAVGFYPRSLRLMFLSGTASLSGKIVRCGQKGKDFLIVLTGPVICLSSFSVCAGIFSIVCYA